MVRVICLSPTKIYSYCSSAIAQLENLILQSSNSDPSTRSNHQTTIQSKQEDTTKNNTPKQKKDFKKSVLKDRARCYGYESARNTENGARTWKLWDKQ